MKFWRWLKKRFSRVPNGHTENVVNAVSDLAWILMDAIVAVLTWGHVTSDFSLNFECRRLDRMARRASALFKSGQYPDHASSD